MRPVYANTFGVRVNKNNNGDIVEITLDISHKYLETATTVTAKGVENISTPAVDQIASIVLSPVHAMALKNLLDNTLSELE
jgi:hypothetical protein